MSQSQVTDEGKTMQHMNERTYDKAAHHFGDSRCGKGMWKTECDLYLELLPEVQGPQLLDLGCGTGRLFHAIKDRLPGISSFIGVDASEGMVKEAEKWNPEANMAFLKDEMGEFIARQGDATYHGVSLLASFHHVFEKEEQERILSHAYRILEKDGVLFITWWNIPIVATTLRKIQPCEGKPDIYEVPYQVGESSLPRFYTQIDEEETLRILKNLGFHIEKILYTSNGQVVAKDSAWNTCIYARKA